ncbi:Rv0909 family putative TA system antitoxin [Curtobacterium sp. ISL-83]|uniref:Rv0909 family putative TA system antitoxin n=1 Tax=Curtobacterium sp. ISL-83 TaxID=2819145 RepID=UPI001BEC2736|nr:Rv0909 family putative TA system antitoxin [Curtobacterium sp. ISL-83]MBT2503523.1 antitoxin [Curtobacterium sp. ISL-83]
MAGFDDITKKAQDLLKSAKVQDVLQSEQAANISDKILGGVADAVNKATGGKHADKVEQARKAADERLGHHKD